MTRISYKENKKIDTFYIVGYTNIFIYLLCITYLFTQLLFLKLINKIHTLNIYNPSVFFLLAFLFFVFVY